MYRWLSGPGQVFKQPLDDSTNYLNAYDRSGNLLRANNLDVRKGKATGKKEDGEDGDGQEENEEGEKQALKKAEMKDGKLALPKETAEDLMPFPMNRSYRSQAVLSEELKDAIWRRVMEEGKSVRDVSASLGVEMRRVAAVVRLKGVEKEWEKEVRELKCSVFLRAAVPTDLHDEKNQFD